MPTTNAQTITIHQTPNGYRADDLRFHRLAAAVSYVERMGAEIVYDLPDTVQTVRDLARLGLPAGRS